MVGVLAWVGGLRDPRDASELAIVTLIVERCCELGPLPIGWTGPVHCELCGAFLYFDALAAEASAAERLELEAHPIDNDLPF